MSLRFNRLEPLFRTIREFPRNGRRFRTRDEVRLQTTRSFIFRVLLAMNLDFHLQTKYH